MRRAAYFLTILAAAVILAAPLWGETPTARTKSAPATEAPVKEAFIKLAPVKLDGSPIFSVQAFHALSAEERALRISERISRIADDVSISTDTVKTGDSEVSTEVMAGERTIMSVYDNDARPFGVTRQALAAECAQKIRSAIDHYRQERAPKSIMHGIVLTAVATVVLLILLVLGRLVTRKLLRVIVGAKARSIHFQKFEILRFDQVRALIIGVIRIVRLAVILVLLYIYAYVTLGFFPWTRHYSGQILHYLLVPLKTMELGVVDYIPNLIFLAVLGVVTRYVLKFMRLIAEEVEMENVSFTGFYPEWAKPTFKIARFLVIAFVAVVAFPYFPGSQSPAFKGVSIFLGVLLSLGSSSTVSNIIAGLDMTYRRAFLKGDWVKIGEYVGEVARMRLLVTHLLTFKNEEIIVPNSVIQSSHVINYSSLARERGLILHTAVTIGYNIPWRQVHAFLLQAAERTPGLLRNPPPFILQTSLDDFYVRYELNAYTDLPHQMLNIYSELHQNIQDAFNEYGVQIMSPHYMSDPRSPAVVPREHWYEPPAKPPGDDSGREG